MTPRSTTPIQPKELRLRQDRVLLEAEAVGFVGLVEYRHLSSQSGGAQYGRGAEQIEDVLTVYAEAFDRDADPEDFSLRAIIAHERGHQLLARHPRLATLAASASLAAEEVLASLLGALVLESGADRDALMQKATFDVLQSGSAVESASELIERLRNQLEAIL